MNPIAKKQFTPQARPAVSVPCNGCSLCCRGDAISIHPEHGDNPADYITVPHFMPEMAMNGVVMLDHKKNGDCIYLSDNGCAIHGKAPALCKGFDCRGLAKSIGFTKARKLAKKGQINKGIFDQGLRLIKRFPL